MFVEISQGKFTLRPDFLGIKQGLDEVFSTIKLVSNELRFMYVPIDVRRMRQLQNCWPGHHCICNDPIEVARKVANTRMTSEKQRFDDDGRACGYQDLAKKPIFGRHDHDEMACLNQHSRQIKLNARCSAVGQIVRYEEYV